MRQRETLWAVINLCFRLPFGRWKEASHKNQLRYAESMKTLKEMYERQ